MIEGKSIDELRIGDTAQFSNRVTENELEHFAQATGDFNPVHFDQAYAENTLFKERIAHGILSIGFISALFGNIFPGPGTIYLTQEVKFLAPVRIGDTITAKVEVMEIISEENRAKFKTTCTNQNGQDVVSGTAWVMPPKKRGD